MKKKTHPTHSENRMYIVQYLSVFSGVHLQGWYGTFVYIQVPINKASFWHRLKEACC